MSKGVSKKPRRGRPTPPRTTDETFADIISIPSDEEATALVDPLPACMANGSDDSSRLLPLQQVARIIRKHLAPNTKVSRDAALLMREAASEFICFIASEARDISVADKRRSITPQDIFESMVALDFEEDARALHCWSMNRSRTSGSSTSTSTTTSSSPSSFPSPSEQHEDPPEALTSAPRISPSSSPSVRPSPPEALADHYTTSTMSMQMPVPMPIYSTWMPVPIPGGMPAMSNSASTHILALQHEYWRRMGHMNHMSHMSHTSHMSHRVTAAGFGQ